MAGPDSTTEEAWKRKVLRSHCRLLQQQWLVDRQLAGRADRNTIGPVLPRIVGYLDLRLVSASAHAAFVEDYGDLNAHELQAFEEAVVRSRLKQQAFKEDVERSGLDLPGVPEAEAEWLVLRQVWNAAKGYSAPTGAPPMSMSQWDHGETPVRVVAAFVLHHHHGFTKSEAAIVAALADAAAKEAQNRGWWPVSDHLLGRWKHYGRDKLASTEGATEAVTMCCLVANAPGLLNAIDRSSHVEPVARLAAEEAKKIHADHYIPSARKDEVNRRQQPFVRSVKRVKRVTQKNHSTPTAVGPLSGRSVLDAWRALEPLLSTLPLDTDAPP